MAEMHFQAADPRTLCVAELDSLTAIYHRTSGITHIVASPVPELLEALAEPLTLDDLFVRLGVDYDMPDADRAALAERIAELEGTGLVARI